MPGIVMLDFTMLAQPIFPKLDTDLLVFLGTVATLLTGSLSRPRKSSVPIPADYDFQEIPPHTLTEK